MHKSYRTLLVKLSLSFFGIGACADLYAQTGVGIGTTTPQAALDVTSTTGGFLPPRMSLEQRGRLSPLVAGLVVYQEDHTPGLYLYNGTAWVLLTPDHLGNHNATQRLNLQDHLLVGSDTGNGPPGATGLRINARGQVGIGNSNPSEKLDVTGNVKVSEAVESEQFRYASSKSRALVIPGSAFTSWRPGVYRTNIEAVRGSPTIPEGVSLAGGTAGQPGYLSAPLYLPQSAIITGMTLIGMDSDGTGIKTAVTLSAIIPEIGGVYSRGGSVAKVELSEIGKPTFQSVTATLHHTMQQDVIYGLTATLNQNSPLTSITSVIISYLVTQPD